MGSERRVPAFGSQPCVSFPAVVQAHLCKNNALVKGYWESERCWCLLPAFPWLRLQPACPPGRHSSRPPPWSSPGREIGAGKAGIRQEPWVWELSVTASQCFDGSSSRSLLPRTSVIAGCFLGAQRRFAVLRHAEPRAAGPEITPGGSSQAPAARLHPSFAAGALGLGGRCSPRAAAAAAACALQGSSALPCLQVCAAFGVSSQDAWAVPLASCEGEGWCAAGSNWEALALPCCLQGYGFSMACPAASSSPCPCPAAWAEQPLRVGTGSAVGSEQQPQPGGLRGSGTRMKLQGRGCGRGRGGREKSPVPVLACLLSPSWCEWWVWNQLSIHRAGYGSWNTAELLDAVGQS